MKMKTTPNSRLKAHQKSDLPASPTQQISTVLSEADYYEACAELALLRSDYFHLQYGY
jgi:hypothetical protein